MSSTGASQQLLSPFLFLLVSLSLFHPNSFADGQWMEKAVRPVNVGREEHQMKCGTEDNTPKEKTWVPKKTKVEVQVEDHASKDNTWVPIDMTKSEEPIMPADDEIMEAEVLVLGAGAAGITVAQRLREEGVEGVVVVEGSDRIGGRVKDVQFGGITVELGANWVHRLICQSSGKYPNVRGTQFRHDEIFGHRCNPIEDLCKVSLSYFHENYFQKSSFICNTLLLSKEGGLKYTEDSYSDYTYRFKVESNWKCSRTHQI